MNEHSQLVPSVHTNAEPGFGLFDLVAFILAHAVVPVVSPTSKKGHHVSELDIECVNSSTWTKQSKPDRLVAQRVLCGVQSRFQSLWSLPPVSGLQFSRKDAAYQANDWGAQG